MLLISSRSHRRASSCPVCSHLQLWLCLRASRRARASRFSASVMALLQFVAGRGGLRWIVGTSADLPPAAPCLSSGPHGPISYGHRHFGRYASDGPALLRLDCAEVFARNRARGPYFCKYNSGSPRCSRGQKSPRGPDTFLSAEEFSFPESTVVEVTFLDEVQLPENIECGTIQGRQWCPCPASTTP